MLIKMNSNKWKSSHSMIGYRLNSGQSIVRSNCEYNSNDMVLCGMNYVKWIKQEHNSRIWSGAGSWWLYMSEF